MTHMQIAKSVLSISFVAGLAAGCSTLKHEADKAPPSPVATNAAATMNASQVAEISFDKGSASLTTAAQQALTNVVSQTRASGKTVDAVKVAAWSDTEYPSDRQEALPKPDRDLADKRATAVKDYLKSINVSGVDTYNMAKQPNGLQKAFNTSDVKVKNAMASAGMPNSESGKTLSGKASHAIVMVITK